ncbi:hypothetical protein D3C85_1683260 [compost metagenome]
MKLLQIGILAAHLLPVVYNQSLKIPDTLRLVVPERDVEQQHTFSRTLINIAVIGHSTGEEHIRLPIYLTPIGFNYRSGA